MVFKPPNFTVCKQWSTKDTLDPLDPHRIDPGDEMPEGRNLRVKTNSDVRVNYRSTPC